MPVGGDPPVVVASTFDALSFHSPLYGLYGSGQILGPPLLVILVGTQPVPVPPRLLPRAHAWYPAFHVVLPPPSAPNLVHGFLLARPVIVVLLPRRVIHRLPDAIHLPFWLVRLSPKIAFGRPHILPSFLLFIESVSFESETLLM
jgi:hypothetical protein